MQAAAVLLFPSVAAREAAAVRQAIRLRGQHCGASTDVIAEAAHTAVAALLREHCSSGWAVHIGCRALRGELPGTRVVRL